MGRKSFHQTFYLLGTIAVVAALPVSHFMMGLGGFLLFLNWLAEWNWQEKQRYLRKSRQGLLFSAFYLFYAIGLVNVTDWGAAGSDMLSKLPFLILPLVVVSSKPFNDRQLQYIFSSFILTTLIGCFCNLIYAQTHDLENYRQMSYFIDHIRFGLCVVMSIVFCTHYLLQPSNNGSILNIIYLITSILLLIYLIYSQTLSGIIILMVITFCFIIHLIVNQKNTRLKWALGGLTGVLLTGSIVYILYISYDYFHVKDPAPDTTELTASGNPYYFDDDPMVENGHYLEYWVCEPELETAWAMRSDSDYNELISSTLCRYLNSLGMRKDSAAVMQLTDDDIHNIEQKTANVYYVRNGHIRRALYETYFGLSRYKKYGVISKSSLLERIELWRASWQVIREHWLFGVGVGQQRAALDRQLELQHSPIIDKKKGRGSHNQFLTFWIASGIIPVLYFCFLLIYPFIHLRKRITFVYFAFILLLFLSMLVEDTLNAQTGRTMFSIFVPLMLFCGDRKTGY